MDFGARVISCSIDARTVPWGFGKVHTEGVITPGLWERSLIRAGPCMPSDRKRILWEEHGCLEEGREEGETEVQGAARLAVGPDMDTLKCGTTSGGESGAGTPREHNHKQPLC